MEPCNQVWSMSTREVLFGSGCRMMKVGVADRSRRYEVVMDLSGLTQNEAVELTGSPGSPLP
jgi:hypothetical protein